MTSILMSEKSIDLCHRDGSIKNKVSENPEKYINRDLI